MRLILTAAILMAFALPAHAVDYAERLVLGFSPDGRYFAFAEYGVQDGSGFPYANAYVIDSSDDSWVKGTPARVLLQDEDRTEFAALGEALAKIDGIVDTYDIQRVPEVVAHNPLTQVNSDPYEVRFLRQMMNTPTDDYIYTLRLSERVLPKPAACPDDLGDFQGMTLTLTEPNGTERTLVDDTQIPSSRNCPYGYRISEVMFSPDAPVMAVLIDVRSLGFEGWDRRFLAVTATVPE
jgi:predicted secreted protein